MRAAVWEADPPPEARGCRRLPVPIPVPIPVPVPVRHPSAAVAGTQCHLLATRGGSGAGQGTARGICRSGWRARLCQERGTWPGGFAAGGWEDRSLGWCLRGATAPGDLWEIHREHRSGTPLCLIHIPSFNPHLGIFQQLLEKPLSIAHCSLSPMGTSRTRREPQVEDSPGVLASLPKPENTELWGSRCSPNAA